MALREAIRQFLGRQVTLGSRDIPTADIYFRYAVGDLIGADGPIRQLGPYTYAAGDALVIIRYATPDEIADVRRRKPRIVYYVIDDIIPLAREARDLPRAYARKLSSFSSDVLPGILALRPVVLAPSAATLAMFPALEGHLIAPCLPHRIDPDRPRIERRGEISICFLGTRSHQECLPLLEAIARRLPDQLPGSRLTLYWGRNLPQGMTRLRAIDNREPLPWPRFRDHLPAQRFDIALAPIHDSVFNQGRSFNKVLDHAIVGAAGIYSPRVPFTGVITDGVDGLFAEDSPEAWLSAIERLAADADLRAAVARAGIDLANSIAEPLALRRDWLERLGLPADAAVMAGR
ncbi:MAG: hypothetical protein SFW09_19330 [Hyphomicrobiaceae bacterium]|nr:hypothetical protein [Hyphomicrobiaceae bacterium]